MAHLACLFLVICLAISCGGGGAMNSGTGAGSGNDGGVPPSSSPIEHIAIVVFENQDYQDVVGSSAMPYLDGLIQQNGLATQFYANVHPSMGNYFMMTAGQVVSTDDAFTGTFGGESVITSLDAAGKSWKLYAESLPAIGYIDSDQYPYIKHHNPFAYFDVVRNNSGERSHLVPLTELPSDMGAGTLPNYAFIVPNNLHNGHDCPSGGSNCALSDRLGAVDTWLESNLDPLLSDSEFQSQGVLIITFDESATDNTMGGGRIATVFTGGRVKTGFQSTNTYQFPSLLRFTLKTLGVSTYPGAAANAPDMNEFLK